MMRGLTRRGATTAAVALALAALAAGSAVAAPPASSSGALPLVTGGVSEEERAAMLDQAGAYNLWLIFAEEGTGHYLANVTVTLEDAGQRPVADVVTTGPCLLAEVPPGLYTVRIGDNLRRTIIVGAERSVAVFRVPAESPTYAILPGDGIAPTLSRPRQNAPQIGS